MIKRTPIKNKKPIEIKKKLCKGCGEETYLFSKGNCKLCDSKKKKKEKDELESDKIPERGITIKVQKPKEKNKKLETFFEKHIESLVKFRRSEESGLPIPFPTKVNICHLFPKRNHKSVEDHETNYIYLTLDEHTTLDNKYLDKHDFEGLKKGFPNSFNLIIERMKIVRLAITEKTNFVESFDKFIETLEN